jgi:hypothetical protein
MLPTAGEVHIHNSIQMMKILAIIFVCILLVYYWRRVFDVIITWLAAALRLFRRFGAAAHALWREVERRADH